MESRMKALGHPIHPMLTSFPLGLLATSVIFDILFLIFGNADFSTVSFWMIIAGIVGGLAAALVGFVDWLSIPAGTRAKSVGLLHGLGNVLVVALFFLSWLLRLNSTVHTPSSLALIFSFAGVILVLLTAWLGGEMTFRLGVAVEPGANLNASSSLSGEPATAKTGSAGINPQVIPATGPSADNEESQRHTQP
jgi:uncharacterized membrane protein